MHGESRTNTDTHVLSDLLAESFECTLTHAGAVINTHSESKTYTVT